MKTLAERVRASEARRIKTGARRLPGGIINADAAQALDGLLASGYAESRAQVIARALVEAGERHAHLDDAHSSGAAGAGGS